MNDQSETIAALRRRVDTLQTRAETAEAQLVTETARADKSDLANRELLMRAMRYQFIRDRDGCRLAVVIPHGNGDMEFCGQGDDLDRYVDREIDQAIAKMSQPS